MKKLTLNIALIFSSVVFAIAQGCIPMRNLVGFGQFSMPQSEFSETPTKWFLNINQRYFKADKTYNHDTVVLEVPFKYLSSRLYVINFTLARVFPNGLSITVDVPIQSGSRTAWRPEHNTSDTSLHTTHAVGIGDVRVTFHKWLRDVSLSRRWNAQIGLGVKLPTGDFRYQDYFYLNDTTRILAPVNTAIQLGDGGTGFTAELNAFYSVNQYLGLYANAFYLFNPRDINGVSNTFGRPARVPGYAQYPSYIAERATANIVSVPDAYTVRAGLNASIKNYTFWTGYRMEGTPVHDVIGESNGQRRAGKTISIDPGLNYKFNKSIFYVFVPVSVYRKTEQTVPDRRMSEMTGKTIASPGGFTRFQVFTGIVFRV